MNLREYENFVESEKRVMIPRTLSPIDTEILALSNALGGECGELQNVVKKLISKDLIVTVDPLHEQFILEAGDTLWYLFRLIEKMGYHVSTIMESNVTKLQKKYADGGDTWRK